MDIEENSQRFTKADWQEAYILLLQLGVRGRIQRLVLLASMTVGPNPFTAREIQEIIHQHTQINLAEKQILRSLNPLYQKGLLKFKVVAEFYDQAIFQGRTTQGRILSRRYYYPGKVKHLTKELRRILQSNVLLIQSD
jgi:hypothetical protein